VARLRRLAESSNSFRIASGMRTENGDISPENTPLGFMPPPGRRFRFTMSEIPYL
jgi:hypothetical protein